MQQKLEEKDENTSEIKETFSSLQQEVDVKTKKLKKASFVLSIKQTVVVVFVYERHISWFLFSWFPCLAERIVGTSLPPRDKTLVLESSVSHRTLSAQNLKLFNNAVFFSIIDQNSGRATSNALLC